MGADIHMSPYDSREINVARKASAQGHLKIEKMEKELHALTTSAMKYKSMYSKSAAQMAKEAMEAAEQESMATKKVRKTVVEESSRRVARPENFALSRLTNSSTAGEENDFTITFLLTLQAE